VLGGEAEAGWLVVRNPGPDVVLGGELCEGTTLHCDGGARVQRTLLRRLVRDLEQLRAYVQRVADASPGEARAIIESAGMSVKRPGLHDKPLLTVKAGPVSATVVVVAKAAGDRATYEWQYSRVGEPWIDVSPTRQAKKMLNGLVHGAEYRFRVRTVIREGRSDFGDAVSFIVA
jgi:hypothetical protein